MLLGISIRKGKPPKDSRDRNLHTANEAAVLPAEHRASGLEGRIPSAAPDGLWVTGKGSHSLPTSEKCNGQIIPTPELDCWRSIFLISCLPSLCGLLNGQAGLDLEGEKEMKQSMERRGNPMVFSGWPAKQTIPYQSSFLPGTSGCMETAGLSPMDTYSVFAFASP